MLHPSCILTRSRNIIMIQIYPDELKLSPQYFIPHFPFVTRPHDWSQGTACASSSKLFQQYFGYFLFISPTITFLPEGVILGSNIFAWGPMSKKYLMPIKKTIATPPEKCFFRSLSLELCFFVCQENNAFHINE